MAIRVKFLAAVAALGLAAPVMASAATVNISYTAYANSSSTGAALAARDAFLGGPAMGEDFEGFTACKSKSAVTSGCANGTINTTGIGSFTGIGPAFTGGGSQVKPVDKIVVRTNVPDPYGRFNVTPGGANWLDSNDMNGILWTLAAPIGTFFDKIAFLLTDLDDVGNFKFGISANGESTVERPGAAKLGNGALHLVTMTFSAPVSALSISMINGVGDGFGFDGGRVSTIAAVPVPAAGLLLLGGLGALAAMKRRRRAA